MSEELAKILDDLGERFGIAIDWSSKNIKPYLLDLMEKYINYEIATSVATIIVSLLICGLCIFAETYFLKNSIKKYEENKNSDWDLAIAIGYIVLIATIVILLMLVTCEIFDIITCCTFPEKEIIDYIRSIQ